MGTTSESRYEQKSNYEQISNEEERPYALELMNVGGSFTNEELRQDLINPEEYCLEKPKDDYVSSADRNLFQNGLIDGFDVITLTTVRIILQVGYHEFTGYQTPSFMESIAETPALAASIIGMLCLLAFARVYQLYQQQQADELRKDPYKLASLLDHTVIQKNEEKKSSVPGTSTNVELDKLKAIQKNLDYILAKDSALTGKYSIKCSDNGKFYLIQEPSPATNATSTISDAQEASPKTQKKQAKGIQWASAGDFAWNILNISAVVYWVAWGLRNLVKPGGFGGGFGTGLNIFIPIGVVLPVMVPLAMLGNKLFNYVNRRLDRPNSKLWDFTSKFFKPWPNPGKGKGAIPQFLGFVGIEIANFFRSTIGFFFVAPVALKKFFVKEELPSHLLQSPLQEQQEGNHKKFQEDAAKIISELILIQKYQKAGLKELPVANPPSLQQQNGTQSVEPTLVAAPKKDENTTGKISTLFFLKLATAYIYLQFTLGWWAIDIYSQLNPLAEDQAMLLAKIAAWTILGLSTIYATAAVGNKVYETRQAKKKAELESDFDREQQRQQQAKLDKLAQAEQALTNLKAGNPGVVITNPLYQDCPAINDKKYFSNIQLTEKNSKCDYIVFGSIFAIVAGVQSGIWIGRGLNLNGTAANPGIGDFDPYNSIIPWNNIASDLGLTFIKISACLVIAAIYCKLRFDVQNQNDTAAADDKKLAQVEERLTHVALDTALFHQITSSSSKGEDLQASTNSTNTDLSNTSSNNNMTPTSSNGGDEDPEGLRDVELDVPVIPHTSLESPSSGPNLSLFFSASKSTGREHSPTDENTSNSSLAMTS